MAGFSELTAQQQWLARELLQFYDDLTALHACNAFVMQALAATLVKGEGLDERSAMGAVFCSQWLNDCSVDLEHRFKNIMSKNQSVTTGDVS